MSYAEWVKFVLDSFVWAEGSSHDFFGYLKLDWEGKQPCVTIDIFERDIRVTVYYRVVLTFEEWKNNQILPDRSFYSTYESLKRESLDNVMSWRCQDYNIRDYELNLLPWVIGIVQRAKS